ncbi:hypothetical protein [Nocardia sp. NPDC052566]|uniref:hypothetical protein n=1 Tax=Nocardia sp. NPDC052566 TaxID=3364330 RepID=UPI0037C7CC7B
MNINKGGRPQIGNTITVAIGDLLPLVEDWAINHGQSRAEGIRDLVRRGLQSAPGERALHSSWDKAMFTYADDAEVLERYAAAIEQGRITRESQDTGPETYSWVRLILITDPRDGTDRWLVDARQPNGGEWIDYPASQQAVADARYERTVRSLAEVDYLFDATDVDGVPVNEVAD